MFPITFDFKVSGTMLTGRAKSDNGDTAITEGKVTGTAVTFVENLNYQGMELKITYTGKIVSDDEIGSLATLPGSPMNRWWPNA